MIPNDPVILLSYINTNLRDFYPNLTDLCKTLDINEEDLISKLKLIDYEYDSSKNQFI